MKRYSMLFVSLCLLLTVHAQRNEVLNPLIKTLQVTVNDDWLLPPIVMLQSDDKLEISFDELTQQYHRYTYVITHHNADWTPSGMMEIDYLNGFNNNVIENYQPSFNTTMLYTHYRIQLPNDQAQVTISGNYVVTVYDEEDHSKPVLKACFSVMEKRVNISATVSGNTDIDTNVSHQQVSFTINYPGYIINSPQNEIKAQVFQNMRTDNMVTGIVPSYIGPNQFSYNHIQQLIFEAGNEYRRFEMVNVQYAAQGIESIQFFRPYYHVTLFPDEQRKNYSYDQDQDGRYFIRYDQGQDNNTEADYMFVHFSLPWETPFTNGNLYLQGEFTYDWFNSDSKLIYNEETKVYESVQLLKQGAYNYLYLYVPEGSTRGNTGPVEGNFYETENEYLILIYHRPFGGLYDKLIGMQNIKFTQD